MKLAIQKSDSPQIALPGHVLEQLGLTEKDALWATMKEKELVLKPLKPKYRLKDLLAEMGPQDWIDPWGELPKTGQELI